jgi:hypothetical protein
MPELVYEGEASATDDSAIWWLIAPGSIGAITMIIVAAILPDKVGPWWVWTAVLVGLIALGWWAMGRAAVVVRIAREGDTLRLRVNGRAANIDEQLRPGYDHWARAERIPARAGGGVMMHFSLTVKTSNGRTIGFRQMGGADTAGWPEGADRVRDGTDVFMTVDIFGLERALRADAAHLAQATPPHPA